MKNPSASQGALSFLNADLFDWFTASRYFNEDSFTARLRLYQIASFTVFFINSFLNFLNGLNSSYIITSIVCIVLILARHLIDTGKVNSAFLLMLLTINVSLILLGIIQGTQSGVFLYFFPCMISFAFLTDLANQKKVRLTYGICFSSFIAAIVLPALLPEFVQLSAKIAASSFYINVFSSLILLTGMTFSLAKENSRKQNALQNKEVFLNTIFNSSVHADIIVDMESFLITNCNKYAVTLFGVPHVDYLFNRHISSLFWPLSDIGIDGILKIICGKEKSWVGELDCIKNDGSQFAANISIVSFMYLDKEYKKITIIDITEKNTILEELQQAKIKAEESVAVKTQFLSHMSHELRTPLNGIIGSANLLLQDECLPAQSDHLNILKFSSEHMLSLINDILDLSKLDANKIKLEKISIDVPKFINNLTSSFSQQFADKEVLFEVEIDRLLTRQVLGDPTRLNQVLSNLLSNALKFTSSGSVKLNVKAVSLKSDLSEIEFSVTDTGIGISEEKRTKIFEQFTQADLKTTRKYGGTGLGLTISQKLVNLMGSNLNVDSKYNKGSRFYFTVSLPVSNGRQKLYVQDNKTFKDNQQLKGLKVLIAEDNPVNMMIATRFLDKWGVNHSKAKNGVEAVSLFGETEFDLILMDLDMPEMDGYGALNAIRDMNASIPAIAFTAAVFENMKENLIRSGFNDYIQKPFRPEDLHSKLILFSEGLSKSA